MNRLFAATLAAGVLLAPAAQAQSLDFGAWCSDVAKFGQDRCLEDRPEDRDAYDKYVSGLERYEKERIAKSNSARIETDRVNRMGDVTADRNLPYDSAADPNN